MLHPLTIPKPWRTRERATSRWTGDVRADVHRFHRLFIGEPRDRTGVPVGALRRSGFGDDGRERSDVLDRHVESVGSDARHCAGHLPAVQQRPPRDDSGRRWAMMVLEPMDSAKARGAKIFAEICGFGMTSDAHHLTQPRWTVRRGRCAALCVKREWRRKRLAISTRTARVRRGTTRWKAARSGKFWRACGQDRRQLHQIHARTRVGSGWGAGSYRDDAGAASRDSSAHGEFQRAPTRSAIWITFRIRRALCASKQRCRIRLHLAG